MDVDIQNFILFLLDVDIWYKKNFNYNFLIIIVTILVLVKLNHPKGPNFCSKISSMSHHFSLTQLSLYFENIVVIKSFSLH